MPLPLHRLQPLPLGRERDHRIVEHPLDHRQLFGRHRRGLEVLARVAHRLLKEWDRYAKPERLPRLRDLVGTLGQRVPIGIREFQSRVAFSVLLDIGQRHVLDK